jgi:hypothetical protein
MTTIDPEYYPPDRGQIGIRYRLQQHDRTNPYSWEVVHLSHEVVVSGQSWADAKDHFDRLERDYMVRRKKRTTGVRLDKFI